MNVTKVHLRIIQDNSLDLYLENTENLESSYVCDDTEYYSELSDRDLLILNSNQVLPDIELDEYENAILDIREAA